jgi:3-oxoacyl-[acyl-carrier-protein] synthase II
MKKRVVVTGLGVVSSLGIGKDIFWQNLIAGKSGIKKITLFDTSDFNRHYAGEVTDFNPHEFLPKEIIDFTPRASQFAIAAAKLALKDARIELKTMTKKRIALILGTTMTEARVYDLVSRDFIECKWGDIFTRLILHTFSSSIPRNVGHFLKVKGINLLIPNACAAANFSLSYAFDLLKKDNIDFAIVGGSDALSRIAFQGFNRLYAMAPDKCSPFDKNRKGMMLGEGAGVLILESLESARQRNAFVYAKILSSGISSDAYHMTIPKKEGICKAIEKALKNAKLSPSSVDYISAHGSGTQANDKNEASAIKEVFKDLKVATSSIKSMLGHTMGAASALEAISCCLTIRDGVLPPTINYETLDPECDIDCVPNKSRKQEVKIALNNGFAFGGNNCCIIFGGNG